jgi:sec-independent protein translocase protein TatA
MDLLTPGHIILVLVGALLIFGPKRLPDIGKSLGKGIREFKGALNHIADDEPATSSTPAPAPPPAPAWPPVQATAQPVDVGPVPPAVTPQAPVMPTPPAPAQAPVDTPPAPQA